MTQDEKRFARTLNGLHSAAVHLTYDRASVSAVDEKGRRYHFWVALPGRTLLDDVLFFKAPLGPNGKHLNPGEQGYFATRQLDATEPRNAAIIKRIRELCEQGKVWERALATEAEAQAAKDRANAARAAHIAKQIAAEDMHAALTALMAHMPRERIPHEVRKQCEAALALAADTTNLHDRRTAEEARYGA